MKLVKRENNIDCRLFIPKNSFTYRKKELFLQPEDKILRKNIKNIAYTRDFMKYKSSSTEVQILNGTKYSNKMSKDIENISKRNKELNLNSFFSFDLENNLSPIKTLPNEKIKKNKDISYHNTNRLFDYYNNLDKKYSNEQINILNNSEKIKKIGEKEGKQFLIKRLSAQNLSNLIVMKKKSSIRKIKQYYSSNVSYYSFLKEENKINKIVNMTSTTFFSNNSINHSNKSKFTKRRIKLKVNDNDNENKIENILKKKNNFFYIPKSQNNINKEIINLLKNPKQKKFIPSENSKTVIYNFLQNQPKEKLISNNPNYRKLYIVLDGTTIISHNFINGLFYEIPKKEKLNKINFQDRFILLKKLLKECTNYFHLSQNLEYIFLSDGTNINDLIDIPKDEKSLILSINWNFKGLYFFHKDYKEEINNQVLKKEEELRKKNLIIPLKKEYKFKIIKEKKKYLLNQSFTFGLDNIDEKEMYYYYSDKDEKRTKIKLIKNTLEITKYRTFAEYHNKKMNDKILKLQKIQNKKIKNFNSKKQDENTLKGIITLIKNYNKIRGEKNKIKVNYDINPEKKTKLDLQRDFDSVKFYGIKTRDKLEQEIFDYKANYEYRADFQTEKNYPDLIAYNIPKVLKDYPKLKRREFFDVFILFKNLLKFCVSYSKNLNKIKTGIDFETFYYCIRQLSSQGEKLAKKIFKAFNIIGNNSLNFDEFFKGFIALNNKEIKEKIEVFVKIIDSDHNGKLSFDEVFDLSVVSLKRTIGNENEKDKNSNYVIGVLGDFFAKLIFQLVDMPLDSEIPINVIKDKICQGGIAAEYLEMFICADNFI